MVQKMVRKLHSQPDITPQTNPPLRKAPTSTLGLPYSGCIATAHKHMVQLSVTYKDISNEPKIKHLPLKFPNG